MTTTPATTPLDDLTKEVAGRETVVLDTSVLVADPDAFNAFTGVDVVLPLTVIEELDRLKTRPDGAGAAARQVVRHLEQLRLAAGGSLATAVDLDNDNTLRVEPNGLRLTELEAFHLATDVPDHRILASALGLRADGRSVTVVSCDGAMRLKADALGLTAVDHEANNAPFTTRDVPGWGTFDVSSDLVADLYARRFVADDDLDQHDRETLADVAVNEFAVLRAPGNQTALARRREDGLHRLPSSSNTPATWGVRARNKEQQFALNLLTDPDVQVVALSGRAGTGKTLLAIAAGLEQTFEADPIYDRIMVLRPMFSVGRQDIGFLPGDVEDKVAPWFDAIVDAMVALSSTGLDHKAAREQLTMWVDQGKLAMEPVTFLRGRSLARTLVILDEIQQLETADVKTVLTRLGEGSKIVVCGDPDQCDNPFTSPTSNGLVSLVAAFRGTEVFGHVALTACERSRIADLAAERL